MSKVKTAWQAGDRVLSQECGLGTVMQVDENNNMFHCLVNFENGVRKWFPAWNTPDVLRKVEK